MSKEIKELKILNLAQTDSVIEAIKVNFEKEESEQDNIIVRYEDSITVEDLVDSLKILWEYETNSDHTIDILIKNLSYDHRKEALRAALKNENLRNPIFLQNVFCLVKGYNTFADAYFEHEQVFLNDEVEFLDIFDDLEEELKEVTYKLVEYYISMLKTCHLTESVENNPNTVKLEPLYENLFNAMDIIILSKLLSSVKDSKVWETKKIVLNSLGYLSLVAEKFTFVNKILSSFDFSNLLDNK